MKKLVALLLTFLLIVTGCNTVEVTKVKDDNDTDSIKFKDEYENVSDDNLYEYATYNNTIETLKEGTGIIYLGFPSCVLCKEITPILNEAAEEKKIETILYYDFKDIRENDTEEYKQLLNLLSDYIVENGYKDKRITAPTVIFVKDGEVKENYIGVINGKSEEIITKEEKEDLKEKFLSSIDQISIEQTTKKDLE